LKWRLFYKYPYVKIIDRYIIRKYFAAFLLAMALVVLVVIIIDFSEKIDKIIDNKVSTSELIFEYYLNFIPFVINLLSPLFIFIAVIFFTSRLAFNTEIVAMLNSGMSFRRLMVPYLFSALVISLGLFIIANFVLPPANKKRVDFEEKYFYNDRVVRTRNIHMQLRPGVFVFMENYNERVKTGWNFSLERVENGKLVYKLKADDARWNEEIGGWTLGKHSIRRIEGVRESLEFGNTMDTILPLHPDDFVENIKEKEAMTYVELREFIETHRLRGSPTVKFYEIEKHKRTAYPFSTIILTLIGVSLSSRKIKGGIGLHIGIGIALSSLFILFIQFSTTFATNGNLHPMLAVWIPNLFFGLVALYLFRKAPK
jgi:lipopolysaccharide export system permease protein